MGKLLYYLLAQKNFRRNLQYRLAHLASTVGSAIFGFIWIAIWQAAAGPTGGMRGYTVQHLVFWAAFGQVMFNMVEAETGLGVHLAVRSGDVSIELLRPVDYFSYVISREAGQQWYRLLYRCIPIFLAYAVTVGYHRPALSTLAVLAVVCALAVYISLCLNYLVGISSFWTTDVRWANNINMTMLIVCSGIQIPLDLLPGWAGKIAPLLPWSALAHYPNMVYLELQKTEALVVPLFWATVLTVVCRTVTARARRKLEVQGG